MDKCTSGENIVQCTHYTFNILWVCVFVLKTVAYQISFLSSKILYSDIMQGYMDMQGTFNHQLSSCFGWFKCVLENPFPTPVIVELL